MRMDTCSTAGTPGTVAGTVQYKDLIPGVQWNSRYNVTGTVQYNKMDTLVHVKL